MYPPHYYSPRILDPPTALPLLLDIQSIHHFVSFMTRLLITVTQIFGLASKLEHFLKVPSLLNDLNAKGQLISKADWHAINSPKKRTDEFDLFAVKSKKAKKINSSPNFLGESMACQSAFEIN